LEDQEKTDQGKRSGNFWIRLTQKEDEMTLQHATLTGREESLALDLFARLVAADFHLDPQGPDSERLLDLAARARAAAVAFYRRGST
jgi:hypothetical protein